MMDYGIGGISGISGITGISGIGQPGSGIGIYRNYRNG